MSSLSIFWQHLFTKGRDGEDLSRMLVFESSGAMILREPMLIEVGSCSSSVWPHLSSSLGLVGRNT